MRSMDLAGQGARAFAGWGGGKKTAPMGAVEGGAGAPQVSRRNGQAVRPPRVSATQSAM